MAAKAAIYLASVRPTGAASKDILYQTCDSKHDASAGIFQDSGGHDMLSQELCQDSDCHDMLNKDLCQNSGGAMSKTIPDLLSQGQASE